MFNSLVKHMDKWFAQYHSTNACKGIVTLAETRVIVQEMREHLRMLCDRYVWLCTLQMSCKTISLTFCFSLTRQNRFGNCGIFF